MLTFTESELEIVPMFNGLNYDFIMDEYAKQFCQRAGVSVRDFKKSIMEDRIRKGCYQSFAMCLNWNDTYLKISPFTIALN